MASSDKYTCRFHGATGRLSVAPILSSRSRSGGVLASLDGESRSKAEAARRARRCVTELVHDYGLSDLWTFTYAIEPDYPAMISTMKNFSRRLRAAGLRIPRVTVPEQSPQHRWHLHVAVGLHLPHSQMERLWGHGFVGTPNLEHAMSDSALDKIANYLTKGFDESPAGHRRYTTSGGLRPIARTFTAPDEVAAIARISSEVGVDPEHVGRYYGKTVAFFPVGGVTSAA